MAFLLVLTADREIRVPLRRGVITIGREESCDVVLDDRAASRRHARVFFDGESARLEPWHNRNPLIVNGLECGSRALASGDRVAIGHTEVRYYDEHEAANAAFEDDTLSLDAVSLDPRGAMERAGSTAPFVSFHELASLLDGARSRATLLEKVAAVLEARFSPSAAGIIEVGGDEHLRPVMVRGPGDQVRLSRAVVLAAVAQRKAVLVAGVHDEPSRSVAELGITSAIATPLFVREPGAGAPDNEGDPGGVRAARDATKASPRPTPTAVLYVDRRGGEAFSEADLEFCTLLGHVFQVLEENALFFAEVRDRSENLARNLGKDEGLVYRSGAMAEVMVLAAKVAVTDAAVLITGESGVGKELAARAVHRLSPRAKKPFVAVNCSAFPPDLIESELFGALRGSYTGAHEDREGYFQRARGGTIFLDEIGDMPAPAQAKILRALQEKRVTPVGGTEVEVDVRVIAATNRDLGTEIAAGNFREDLFYRLNTITLHLPPLRERPDDILLLARHFAARHGAPDARIEAEAEAALLAHPWPGNVRELRNVVERALILGDGRTLTGHALSSLCADQSPAAFNVATLEEVERRHILRVLSETGGNKKRAAEILGINRDTLYKKLERYGLKESARKQRPRKKNASKPGKRSGHEH